MHKKAQEAGLFHRTMNNQKYKEQQKIEVKEKKVILATLRD